MAKRNPGIIKKTFEHWLPQELEKEFGLVFNENIPELTAWISEETQIPTECMPIIEKLRISLLKYHVGWNEMELVAKFIAPFLSTVDFSGLHFETFFERTLKINTARYELSGVVDFVAAKGIAEPEKPYFFLHEYKRYKGNNADPWGQVLSAMYAAQTINNNQNPVYGCYIAGYIWRFVLLIGNVYSISEGFDASSKNEIAKIWSILQETKRRVEEMAKEND